MEQVGFLEGIEPFLAKSCNGVQGRFMCMAWRRVFDIQEIVYKELVVEFLATVSFRRKIGALENGNVTFCLGGERRELSLAELAMRTEIYLPIEFHTNSYLEFITGSIHTTDGFKNATYLPTIENGTYHKGCKRFASFEDLKAVLGVLEEKLEDLKV
ncbi:unnamed protein product [Lactuca virosa]|uniref:Uncharacterized protein n=1 Tax=Lactuca virosa TaxID=75947 RepID=A0AAU9NEC8_9ASTR|nr:unnamed protein product [Lactuca virosa]